MNGIGQTLDVHDINIHHDTVSPFTPRTQRRIAVDILDAMNVNTRI